MENIKVKELMAVNSFTLKSSTCACVQCCRNL